MESLNTKTKIAIVEQNMAIVNQSIYNAEIGVRVAKKTVNAQREEQLTKEIEALEKGKDEFEKILKELNEVLEKESKKE